MGALIFYIVLGIGAIVLITLIILIATRKPKTVTFDATSLLELFDKSNIRSIDFIRNKIVVDFVNIDFFNPEELQERGALGISVVGDKIKFYVEGSADTNQHVYQQLKEKIER